MPVIRIKENKKVRFIERFNNCSIYQNDDGTYRAEITGDITTTALPLFNRYNDIERLKESIEQYGHFKALEIRNMSGQMTTI